MPDHQKFAAHHKKAGAAFDRGDTKTAAHHMGHALAALRKHKASSLEVAEVQPSDDPDVRAENALPEPANPQGASTLRSRLKGMGKK